jgi:hypothetical protein
VLKLLRTWYPTWRRLIPHTIPTSPVKRIPTHNFNVKTSSTPLAHITSVNPYLQTNAIIPTITPTMPPNWDRLIRFIATDGRELRGEPILPSPDFDVGTTTAETGLKAKVIKVANNDIFDAATKVTDEEVTVKELLGPVTQEEVPIIRCIGLNFIKHSASSHNL